MSFIKNRLRRLEEQGHRCPDCGLAPDARREMAVVYEEDHERSFEGDPYERCPLCGRSLYTVLRVVYEGEGGGEPY